VRRLLTPLLAILAAIGALRYGVRHRPHRSADATRHLHRHKGGARPEARSESEPRSITEVADLLGMSENAAVDWLRDHHPEGS
jgi:hypothetical protein